MEKVRKFLWLVIPILILTVGFLFPIHFSENIEGISVFVQRFGILGPLIFLMLQMLQVVVTPINQTVISMAGGMIFGFRLGFLLNWLGRILGSSLAFLLARKLGRSLVQKKISTKNLKRFNHIVQRNKVLVFLMYALPFFPDDELCYVLGTSRISFKKFLLIIIPGLIPGPLFTAGVGSGFWQKDFKTFAITFVPSIIFFLVVAIFYKPFSDTKS